MSEPDPYRGRPPGLQRAVHVLRSEGARVAVLKALDATVYARLRLLTRPTAGTTGPLPEGPEGRWVDPDVLTPFEDLRPGIVALARRRAARGDRCFATFESGELASVRWVSTGIARLEHLGLDLTLPPTVAYAYDMWTDPRSRRRGHGRAGNEAMRALLVADGIDETLRAVVPENTAALALAAASPGIREVGTAYRLGHGRLAWRFVRWSQPLITG